MTDTGGVVRDRLERAAQHRREARALKAQTEAAVGFAQQAQARVAEARDALATEDTDVRRLESLSWTKIVATVRGSHLTDLDREAAERQAAEYAAATAQARAEAAQRDVDGLQAQLQALGDVDREYAEALVAKEQWAAQHDAATAEVLGQLADRRGVLLAEDGEARQAHAAGVHALELLGQAQQLLASAQSWATWDTFGGGGMLTDMMKYEKLDQVSRVLHGADAAIVRFSAELADLDVAGVEAIRMDGMTQTFDVFFDNIFSDMSVRRRIEEAAARVEHAVGAVRRTLEGLSERGRVLIAELADLDTRREQHLLG